MSVIINSFFCSISAFLFSNIVTFILFILFSYLMYYYVIKKLNRISKVLYLIFISLIIASGIVLVLLPSKEDVMSSIVINSYYFGPVEFLIILLLFISMLSSKYDKKVYKTNENINIMKIDNNDNKVTKRNSSVKKSVKKKIKETDKDKKTKNNSKKTTKKSTKVKTKE